MFKRYGVWLTISIAIVIVLWWWFWCAAETVVVLARHADRVSTEEELNESGRIRGLELVHVLEKAGLAAIIHSNTIRARQTVADLAAATGIVPIEIPANDSETVVNEIRNNHRGRTVFVVGHSNTVPLIVAGLGGPEIPEIADTEFDNLFVLPLCRCTWRPARLLNLQYGATSPTSP